MGANPCICNGSNLRCCYAYACCFVTECRYAYYGSEPLYSGLTGTIMHADIFIGLVYYQRLRHMVSDKSQVLSDLL